MEKTTEKENVKTKEMPAIKNTQANNQPMPADDSRTLGEYWRMITKHWIGVLAIIVVFIIGGGIYGGAIKKAKWKCTGNVLVSDDDVTDNTGTTSVTTNNISATLTWVNTISDFLEGNLVLNKVAEDLKSDGYSYSPDNTAAVAALYSSNPRSYTSSAATSLYIDVASTTSNKTLSAKVVSYVLNEGQNIIDEDYANHLASKTTNGCWQFKRYYEIFFGSDYTSLSATDVSTSLTVIIAAAGLIGLVVGVAYAIIREVNNVYVVSKKELENMTGLKVIGVIPDYHNEGDDEQKKGGK
jgi:capsular polysaccharide biosynthesis protein